MAHPHKQQAKSSAKTKIGSMLGKSGNGAKRSSDNAEERILGNAKRPGIDTKVSGAKSGGRLDRRARGGKAAKKSPTTNVTIIVPNKDRADSSPAPVLGAAGPGVVPPPGLRPPLAGLGGPGGPGPMLPPGGPMPPPGLMGPRKRGGKAYAAGGRVDLDETHDKNARPSLQGAGASLSEEEKLKYQRMMGRKRGGKAFVGGDVDTGRSNAKQYPRSIKPHVVEDTEGGILSDREQRHFLKRARGGSAGHVYPKMKAGAGSGEGRAKLSKIQRGKRT